MTAQTRNDQLELTPAQREVLELFIDHGMLTNPLLERIRGRDGRRTVDGLVDLGLLRVMGLCEELGRPLVYAPTERGYAQFGI